jgi:ESF2/ABP1 family protein
MSSKAAGKKRAASPDIEVEGDDIENVTVKADNNNNEEDVNAEGGPSTIAVRPKSKFKTSSKKRKPTLIPGIVYISRLPPGMTPQKVKYLMAQWGDVGKIYAQKRDGECLQGVDVVGANEAAPTGYNPNANASKKKKEKHAAANYSEAWVEFLDKNVAKTVASMMNAQVIGGKKGDK